MKTIIGNIHRGGGKTLNYLLVAIAALAATLAAQAETYYKVGSDPYNSTSTSFNNSPTSGSFGWAKESNKTKLVAVSDWGGSDFIVDGSIELRLPPNNNDSPITFNGKSLTLMNGGKLTFKRKDSNGARTVVIDDLAVASSGGALQMANNGTAFTLQGALDVASGGTLTIGGFAAYASGQNTRTLLLESALTGDSTTRISITGQANSYLGALTLGNAAGFCGTITDAANYTCSGFTLSITNGFGGTITSLPDNTTKVLVNIDDATTANGLRVATTTIPAPLKTAVVLYTDTKDTLSAGDVVMTFPAGTTVDPAEFTVAFAYGVSGSAATLPLETAENGDGTVFLVVKNDSGSTYVWTGADGDGKMSTGGNWEGGVAPGAGAALDFSAVTEAKAITANGLTYGAVTMGTGVITFTGSLTATSFSDTANISVAANSTVTLNGDLRFTNTAGRYILKAIDAGGRFVVTGDIELTSSATAELKPFEGTGTLVVKGLVANASKSGSAADKDYIFRLSRPTNNTAINWIIGADGLSGNKRFWCFGGTGRIATIQPDESDFNVTTTIGVDAGGTLNLNTTGYDGKAHKIAFTGNGSINQEGTVNIKGDGTVELDNNINGGLTVNVKDTATLSVKRGMTPGNKNSNVTVESGATLEVAESAATQGAASVTPSGNLTFKDGAVLKFNFTDRKIAPVLAKANGKTVTVGSTVYVKVSADASIGRPRGGAYILTSDIDFTGKTVALADGNPGWAAGVSVDDSGNLVLKIVPNGLIFIVR